MWPKAFAQLIELAPHISRLLPMADRFFQSKAADDGNRKAMESMVEGLRGDLSRDLGQVAAAHADLYKQLNEVSGTLASVNTGLSSRLELLGSGITEFNTAVGELGAKVASTAADVRGARLAAESVEARLTKFEARQSRLFTLFAVVFLMLAAVLVLLAMLVARGR